MVLFGDVPHFNANDWILLTLGDSNGGFMIKNRCHGGPFKVIKRLSSSSYLICGADEVPVKVSACRVGPYVHTLADVLGSTGLAASALGAAQARLMNFEQNDPALE